MELERVLSIELSDAARSAIPNELDRPNPWAIYNTAGEPILDIGLCFGTLLIFEGGVFIYPAIRIGFERDILIRDAEQDGSDTSFQLVTLSVHPPVFVVKNYI